MIILQQLSSYNDIPKNETDKYLKQLRSYENIDDILEILIKELSRSDNQRMQVIAYLIIELGNLMQVKNQLWEYIKDPASSDVLKDLSGVILKSLGDTSTSDELLSYLNNPEELVDSETQKLLEIAAINPEAQIDFLDFLFSLPQEEQINLLNSLIEDFSNEHLANIFIPALESSTSEELSSVIIETLGSIRSPYAISCLNDIIKYSNSNNLTKLAHKSLNMLKLAGIDFEQNANLQLGAEVCANSTMYRCYASIIDGAGNQGIIISRKKENGDILTFSTVINDLEGIVDCFGFYGISKNDYARIVDKFQGELAAVEISPEYCRYKLIEAEKINKVNNIPVRYEYISWKALINDVEHFNPQKIYQNINKWADSPYVNALDILFSHPEFKFWFLGENFSRSAGEFLNGILNDIITNKTEYLNNPKSLLENMNNRVQSAIPIIFNNETIELYKNRLTEVAFLFDVQGIELLRNIVASIAIQIKNNNKQIFEILFFDYLLKKSIIEHLIRYYNCQNQGSQKVCPQIWGKKSEKKEFPKNNINEITEILIREWRQEENE